MELIKKNFLTKIIHLLCFALLCFNIKFLNFNYFIILYMIISIYLIDFVSGVVHIILDNEKFLNKEILDHSKNLTPKNNLNINFFKKLCYDFQTHHVSPNRIINNYLHDDNIIGIPFKILFLPIVIINFIFYYYNLSLNYLFIVNFTIIFGLHAQFFHQLTHKNYQIPFFLNIKSHKDHHIFPHDKNFCIMTGWANPLLNFLYNKCKDI